MEGLNLFVNRKVGLKRTESSILCKNDLEVCHCGRLILSFGVCGIGCGVENELKWFGNLLMLRSWV